MGAWFGPARDSKNGICNRSKAGAIMILSEARDLLYDVVVPSLDSQENVDRFDRALNLVQERYINSGKWLGMVREMSISSSAGYFTLPPRFVAALAVKNGPCGCPMQLANRWYAYHYGSVYTTDPSLWPQFGYAGAIDAGDGFTTFKDSPYATYYLRFTRAVTDDTNVQILVKGSDDLGVPIFTNVDPESYEGMTVTLSSATVTTTQKFSGRVEYLLKPRTRGYIYLDAVDVTSAAVTRIGYYAPSETAPCYHRYLNGCTEDDSFVMAMCKIRYTPAVADSDEIIPGNVGALRAGLAAIKCEREGDVVRRDQFLADGLRILSDETRENRGGTKFSLRIDPVAYQFGRLFQGA
jgi:hypothetical protein